MLSKELDPVIFPSVYLGSTTCNRSNDKYGYSNQFYAESNHQEYSAYKIINEAIESTGLHK
jgi:hypothetical protein